ncbi:hypothetical protein [Phenylobacterium sp.]|uniref:hypothetical protein n=1 Tax=Phenylobacterium sp. TaxID=1871053 RepID=UPI0035B4E363
MSTSLDDMAEMQRVMLGELAEMSMALARRLHGRAMAAETDEEAQKGALAFQRAARSVRQTLALQAKIERDRRRLAAEAERAAGEARREAVRARRSYVGDVGSRLIWTEAEPDEVGALLVELKRWLDAESFFADEFAQAPVEHLIARLRQDLGLAANDDPDPEGPDLEYDAAEPPERRSSG